MIISCNQADEERILSYIGTDYRFCLYLYLDLKRYGADSDTIEVYMQQVDGRITSLLLRYYSCLHVYSKGNDFCAEELVSFFIQKELSMIYCTTTTAARIQPVFSDSLAKRATITNGWVAMIKKIDKQPRGLAVAVKKQYFDQIVKLIYNDDDIGKSYKYEELAKQIEERNMEGYARNLVIVKDGLVIAHACTNAETDNIAVVAELLVREEYRKQGYASEMMRELCGQLLSEGKEVFSFYYSEESRTLHKHIGFYEICRWSKIVVV